MLIQNLISRVMFIYVSTNLNNATFQTHFKKFNVEEYFGVTKAINYDLWITSIWLDLSLHLLKHDLLTNSKAKNSYITRLSDHFTGAQRC